MPKYKVNGKLYDIPEDKVEKFESKYPNATVEYHNEGTTYMIPLSKREQFETKYPNATLGVQAASVVAPEEEEKGNSAQDVVPRNVVPVQPMREEPEEVLPKEDKASEISPEEVQKRIRQRAVFDFTQQGVDESIREGEARVGRILEPLTAEGRKKLKAAEAQARMAGAETTLLGLTPSYPGQKGEGGSQEQDANNILGINTNYKKPVAKSPVPYGVEYVDGKPVTQWLMPDGSITTNFAEADQAENEARKGRLRQEFERRMEDNGYIPGVTRHEENQTLIDAIVTGNNIGEKEHEAIVDAMRANGLDPKNSEHAKWVVTEDQRSILRHRSEVAQERLEELYKQKREEENRKGALKDEEDPGFLDLLTHPSRYGVSNKYTPGSGAIDNVSPQVAGTARTQLDKDIEAATAEVLLAEKAIKEYDNNRKAAGKGWFGKTMQGLGDALTDINTYTFGVIDASANSAVRNADITSEYGRRLIETAQLSQDLMLKAPNPGGWYSGSRFVGSMVFDPTFYISGGFGSLTYKGAVKGLGKIVAREATEDVASRLVGQKLVGRMAAGAASSAANLGTFELLGDMRQQWIDGGWTDSNGNFHEGFSLSHALGRGGHGAMLGSVMGIWGAGVGNVADKMVKGTSNVVGKTAIRAGQVPVSIVGEGTIFAMPDIINYHSMSDDEFDKLYADKFGYAGESDEALRNAARDEARSQLSWDAWSESQAFIFGMKVAGKPLHAKKIIKTAGDRIKELKGADEREHRSFSERLSQMMDKSPLDVVMTREELDELRKGGYGELADLFVKSKKGTTAEAEPADRAIDFQRMEAEEVGTRREFDGYDAMQKLMGDRRISQSARAKGYFILTGCMLPMGTVTGYTKSTTAEGKIVVNSVTADGEVVTSRTFKSEKTAAQEVAKIKRQAELNSIDVGEKFANEALNLVMMEEVKGLVAQRYKLPEEAIEDIYTRQIFGERISEAEKQIVDDINSFIEQSQGSERYKSLTPEAMRDRIEEETGVNVDEALRKSEADRSEAENGAIKEYAKSLYEQAERVRRANNIYNEQSAEMRDEAWRMQRGDRLIEDGRAAEIKESVANRTHKDSGVIIPATMKVGDRPVYIIKGDVVMFADGSAIDVEKSSESVVIVDAQTGEKEFVSPDQIYKLSDALNPHEVLSAEMDAYERMMRAERDSEIVDNSYNTDETDNAEGGDVLSTGEDEGDEGQRRDYAPGDKLVMEDSSGNIIYGEIVDYDAADDRYVVDVDSPIRGGYSPQMTREELDGMVVGHNGESVEKKMSMPTEKVETEVGNDSYDRTDNGLGVVAPLESGEIEPQSALSRIPIDEKSGEPMYESVDAETAWDAIVEQTEGDDAMAQSVVAGMVADKESALKKLEKAKSKGGVTIAEKIASEKERKAAIEAARKEVESWKRIADTYNRRIAEAEERRHEQEAERRAAEQAEAARLKEVEAAEQAERDAIKRYDKELAEVYDEVKDSELALARLKRLDPETIDEAAAYVLSSHKLLWGSDNVRKGVSSETGIGEGERRKLFGLFASREKGGKTIGYLSEEVMQEVCDDYGIPYDNMSARDALIELVRTSRVPSDITHYISRKRAHEAREIKAQEEAYVKAQEEEYYQERYHMSKEEYDAYEVVLLDDIENRAKNFDENEFYGNIADEKIEREKIGYGNGNQGSDRGDDGVVRRDESEGTSTRDGGGAEVLSPSQIDKWGRGEANAGGPRISGEVGAEMSVAPTTISTSASGSGGIGEIKPIGRGAFGNIYDQFKGNAKEAYKFLLKHKDGDLLGVFQRDGFGGVDLVWGNKSGGAEHILDKHVGEGKSFATEEDAFTEIDRIIKTGEIDFENGDKVVFKSGNKLVTVRKNWRENGKKIADKNWVLTAYDEKSADSESPVATNKSLAGSATDKSHGKDTTISPITNELGEKSDISSVQGQLEGFEGYSREEVKEMVLEAVSEKLSDVDVEILGLELHGSRSRGGSGAESDLDAVVEYSGDFKEDAVFNLLHDDAIVINGVVVDVNPIRKEESGTLADYMQRSRGYDAMIRAAEAEVNTNPTEAQKEAGNYKKGHVQIRFARTASARQNTSELGDLPSLTRGFGTFNVTIEQPKGSVRRGVDTNGKEWATTMQNTYGYIRGTEGVDGDHIDVFLSDDIDGWNGRQVYVVDQRNDDGSFDEHKVMLGFNDISDAESAYMSNYEEGWQGLGAITGVAIEDFEKWIGSSHRKTKPFAEYKSVKRTEGQSASMKDKTYKVDKGEAYTIAPAQYTTKRGKVLDMQLVKFSGALTKEQQSAAKEFARAEKGWWDREQGGFMMRSEESAKQLVEMMGNEESVADNQPLTAEDYRKEVSPVKEPKKSPFNRVDVEGLFESLRRDGEATLSAHAEPIAHDEVATGSKGRELHISEDMKRDEDVLRDILGIGEQDIDNEVLFRDSDELTPEQKRKVYAAGVNYSMGYIEQGIVQFEDFARAMTMRLGGKIKPWIKSFYEGVKRLPGYEDVAFTLSDEVDRFDVEGIDKPQSDLFRNASLRAEEQKVDKASAQAREEIKENRNENRKKEYEQTTANTVALAEEAGVVASEARSVAEATADREELNRVNGKIDKVLDDVNNQLALLGYYEAELDDSKFHEMYGYMLTAEKKAVNNATELAKQLVKDLGLDFKVTSGTTPIGRKTKSKDSVVRANVAPAGGDVAIRLPLREGKTLAMYIGLDPADKGLGKAHNRELYSDDLYVSGIMYRIEDAKATGSDRYGSNMWAPVEITYGELLRRVKEVAREYLPAQRVAETSSEKKIDDGGYSQRHEIKEREKNGYKVGEEVWYTRHNGNRELATIVDFGGGADVTLNTGLAPIMYECCEWSQIQKQEEPATESQKEIKGNSVEVEIPKSGIKKRNKKAVTLKPEQTMPDLFGGLFGSEINNNLEPTTGNGKKTDVQVSSGTTERASGHEPRQNESLGASKRHEDERTDGRGMGGRSELNTLLDGERSGSVSELSKSAGKSLRRLAEGERKNVNNNYAERGVDYAPKGDDARIKANIDAIELAKQLLTTGADATPEQMAVLRKFSGWGGLGKAFSTAMYSSRLNKLLGESGYQDAVDSRRSAYYTPAEVIDTLWDIAQMLGFEGGNVLEGSAGIGNILGLMPRALSDRSSIHAIEKDSTTGGILSLLYPDAKVDVQGFEETKIPNNSVDLAITNVPFVTGLKVFDKSGDKDLSHKFRDIHDFCIAKNIRKLREGGIGIFISSNGTLDSSTGLRRWIINEGNADVVGAFRLHNETFGGAPVTSDIIVVRKRVNGKQSPNAIDVLDVVGVRTAEYDTGDTRKVKGKEEPILKTLSMTYNKYFVEHPENMAGEMLFAFERGETFRPESRGLFPIAGKSQSEMLKEWVNRMREMSPEEQAEQVEDEVTRINERLGDGVKEGSMVLNSSGELCVARMGEAVPLVLNSNKVKGKSKAECFRDYTAIKKALSEVLEYQSKHEDNEGLMPLLKELNRAFDKFTGTYGNFHKNPIISFLRNDVDFSSIQALESYAEKGDKSGKKVAQVGKTDIFRRRVIEREKEPQPTTIKDGIIASLYMKGVLDPGYIADALGKSVEEVKREIVESGLGFENPATGIMEVSYRYLSGNVREKLVIARENNEGGKYDANIKALESAIPKTIPAHLIEFTLGASWIDAKLYEEFVYDKTGLQVKLTNAGGTWFMDTPWSVYNEKNRAMAVESKKVNKTILGHELIEAALTNRNITVSKTVKNWDGTTETITDKVATAQCGAKVDELRSEFKDWARDKMQKDAEMSARIEEEYNEQFNNYVPMSIPDGFVPKHFGGQVRELHGKEFALRPHQGRAVVRGTTEPVLLAHEVGTGKTYTLITTAMEMRRLGTAKKPMIVVQNATVGQFVESAKEIYPNAKILTIEEADRTAEGRKNFYAKIKYNDWDMIVVPQSIFERIPDSAEREMAYIQDIIDEKLKVLEDMREADTNGKSMITRQAEKDIESQQARLAELTESIVSKKKKRDEKREATTRENAEVRALEMLDREVDEVENFDDMGIDALLVDEAHEYKHLGFATAMQRGVKGVDPSYSKKSQGLYLKVQAVMQKNNGRNVVFATGTPISNTAAEIWTFMRYLMPADTMKTYGIYYFDDFVRNFGNISQMVEFATNGKFKVNNRFAGYVNLPELVRIWSSVADTVLTSEAGGVSDKIPEMEGGKAQDKYLPQTRALRQIMLYVKAELAKYDEMTGKQKKENSHIPLTMYGIAKAAAVDARLVVDNAEDDPNSKTNATVRETMRSLADSKKYKGTVAIFADNYQNKRSGFNLYDDIREKLISQGVPADEIVIIRSGMTVKKKLEIFEKVNSGEIRVIMGSTFTLGTGVNIQERLHTAIHIDAPNRPMDYTQRNGRILRQGNLHKDMGIPVRIIRFGVEDSLDVTAYQRLKTKGAIADSVMNGSKMMQNAMENRVLEEEEDMFGDMTAQLSGSEYAILKNQAEREVRNLSSKQKGHDMHQVCVHNRLPEVEKLIKGGEARVSVENKNLETLERYYPEGRFKKIRIGKLSFESVDGMADFFKEQNKKMEENVKKVQEGGTEVTSTLTVDIDGLPFVITTTVGRKVAVGTLQFEPERKVTYSCEELGIKEVQPNGNRIKGAIEEITTNIVTGKQSRKYLKRGEEQAARYTEEKKVLEESYGKEFPFKQELEDAKKRLAEYEELMKKELEEKEAKYAELDATLDAAEDVQLTEDASEEAVMYRDGEVIKDRVEDLFNQAISGEFKGKPVSIGRLTEAGKVYLEQISGVSFKDKVDFVLNPSDLVHIYNDHFGNNEKDKGQNIPLDIEDIRSIVDVVSSPDKVIFFKEGEGLKRNMFYFFKGAEQGTYNLMEIYSDKKGNLTAKTFYKTRKDASQRVMDIDKSLLPTSETYFGAILSDANIPQMFENPSVGDDYSVAEGSVAMKEARVAELSEALNTPIRVISGEGEVAELPSRRRRSAKGWYDREHDEVVVVLPNNVDVADVENTVVHEVVGHKGLRELIGEERFGEFVDEVYEHATEGIRRVVDGRVQRMVDAEADRVRVAMAESRERAGEDANAYYYADMAEARVKAEEKRGQYRREATEEYMADMAGKIGEAGFEKMSREEQTLWGRIKAKVQKFLDAFLRGLKISNRIKLGDKDIAYILFKSWKHKRGGGVFAEAEEVVMREGTSWDEAVRYNMGDAPETFKARQKRAVENKGTVMLGLNSAMVKVVEVPRHTYTGSIKEATQQAIEAAKSKYAPNGEAITLHYANHGVEFDYKISGNAIEVVLSPKHQAKSANKGVHLSLAEHIDKIINESIEVEEHPDRLKADEIRDNNKINPDALMHRFYGVANIDGVDYRVMTLMKEENKAKRGNGIHSYEVQKIEVLDEETPNTSNGVGTLNSELEGYPLAKVIKDVGKTMDSGKKLLEESKKADEGLGEEGVIYRDGDPEAHEREIARWRYEERVKSGWYQTKEALQDSMLGLKEAMLAIAQGKSGRKVYIEDIAGFENAYLGENRLSSVNQAEADAMARLVFKPMLKEISRLAKGKKRRAELKDYMMAKHGLERNAYMREQARANDEETDRDFAGLTALTGIYDYEAAELEAQRMVDEYEMSHDTRELWKRVNAVSDAILSKSYECGLMSKETYEKVSGMYDYYIPLRGFEEKTSGDAYAYLLHKGSAFNAPIKKAEGRSSKADDPIVYLQSMAENVIMQGNRNKLVKQRFLNFVMNHPSDLASVSDLWIRYDSVKDEWEPVFPDNIDVDDTAEEVERKMELFEEKMSSLSELYPDEYKRGKDAVGIPYRVVDSREGRQHQIVVKRNGRDYVITINGNPRAAQAVNGLTNPDNNIGGVAGAIFQLGTWTNRQLSKVYTTRNPDFVVSNFIRDMLYSNSMMWVRESPNYALRYHMNYARVNPVVMRVLLYKYNRGTLDMSDKTESMFYHFMMNGGETGYVNVRDIEKHRTDIERELGKHKRRIPIGTALSLLGKQIDNLNRSVENCARFAAFVTSREMGRSVDRSIYDAKEVSVNFNKKGSGDRFYKSTGQTHLGNTASALSGGGRALYVFWNAAIQGTTNFGRQVKRHPIKALMGMASMYLLGALVASLGADDDDEKNGYYNLPEYVRRSNIVFKAGDSWISIPLPIEYRALYGMGELMVSTLSGKERKSDVELAEAILGQATQVLPLDFMEGGEGMNAFVPSGVKPIWEAYVAEKSWTGLPLYKDTPYNKHMPEWTKSYSSANKHIVGLTAALNEASGGDKYTKGSIDINPAKVEYMLNGYLGGYFNIANRLVKTVETISGEREFDPHNVLLLNRLVKRGDERTEYRAVNNDYFKVKEEYEKTKQRLKGYEHDTGLGIFDYAEKMDFIYNSPEYTRYLIFEAYQEHIAPLTKELKDVVDEDSRKELESEINSLKEEMLKEIEKTYGEEEKIAPAG